jgi:hypothetical protein
MSDKIASAIFEEILEAIEIPPSAVEKAKARYKNLAEWFGRPESRCSKFDPHIYPQGSFRLGTPNKSDEYDVDFGCRLRKGITKATHSQKTLKELVGDDMKAYRTANKIESPVEEKQRCWRLKYADELAFHLDGVPSIPEESGQHRILEEAMVKAGSARALAQNVAAFAGSITDNTLENYSVIHPHWRISNSEGYALWFNSRVELGISDFEKRALLEARAQVDELPVHSGTSPLQQSVKLLKAHRDVMFAGNRDRQPISVIITTLAAEAYSGESDLPSALNGILRRMRQFVRTTIPRVPNPVNPVEDFADKWYNPKNSHLDLERNFDRWLEQAQIDFAAMAQARDADFLGEMVEAKLASAINTKRLAERFGPSAVVTSPKIHKITEPPPQPWCP